MPATDATQQVQPSRHSKHVARTILAGIVLAAVTWVGTARYPHSIAANALRSAHASIFGRPRITPRDTTAWVHAIHNDDGSLTCITHWEHPELHERLYKAGTAPGHTTLRALVSESGWGPWFPVQFSVVAFSYEFVSLPTQHRPQFYSDLTGSLQLLHDADGHPDWLLRLRDESRRGFGVPRYSIAWLGILLNLITITAVTIGGRSGYLCIRVSIRTLLNAKVSRRRSRGLCPYCAYSLADHAGGPCPECGKSDAELSPALFATDDDGVGMER